MKFGLYGTNAHVTVGSPEVFEAVQNALIPLPDGVCDKQFEFGLQILEEADRVGFDIILFAERHLGPDLTTWAAAAAIGSRMRQIRSMVAVHPGLWHPALVAKLAVTLDRICKGGMAINIVAGANEAEFKMFGGTALIGSEDRYARATEFIDVVRGLWTNKTFSYEGKFYQLRDAELRLKPRHSRPPEIYTAAGSERGRDMVAQTGDWWFLDFARSVQSKVEMLRSLESSIADMRLRMERTGRHVRFAFNPFISLGASEEHAFEAAAHRITSFDSDADSVKVKQRMLPATFGGCIGTPLEVRRQIKRYEDMGVELLLFKMAASVDNVRRIGEDVISHLRAGENVAAA
jgi:FMNH2-dependent dimethyl sulfone monooxygenase